MGILRVIGRGLEIRQSEPLERSEEEQIFATRVQSDLRKLSMHEWKRGQTFEMDAHEALFAVDAIRDNSVHEFVKNSGHLREFDSYVANNARPIIEDFARQAAA
jgi:hypothetical protein